MRLTVVSRIFAPEPSAASFRLRAVANSASHSGHAVTVLTSMVPRRLRKVDSDLGPRVEVRRAPVLRDKAGYVRGYLQYMSFDIPLMFRLLVGRRPDVVLVEPPPTTGAIVRLACAIRRVPYVYYAADVWSDAARMTGAPSWIVDAVRSMEKFAMRGARRLLSVSTGVTERLAEWGLGAQSVTVGNGIDLEQFCFDGEAADLGEPYFVYAGTASEVHGAVIFVQAFERVLATNPQARLVFIGQGAEWDAIAEVAHRLPTDSIVMKPRMEPEQVAIWLRGARASLASVRTGGGYDFAFPTKIYASAACGTPVIYAGTGPGHRFVDESIAGDAVPYELEAVASAMARHLETDVDLDQRRAIARWAAENVDIDAVAARAVDVLTSESRPA